MRRKKEVEDMIKDALQYIVGLKAPVISEIGGQTYSDKLLSRISYIPYADHIEMSTLTSLLDYIVAGVDSMKGKMIVHVVSPVEVRLYSKLDSERKREEVAVVRAQLPSFDFGRFIDNETFLINLQSKFIDNADRALILKFAGTVEDGTVAQYGDDGVTQQATVKSGIASKTDAIVPNPVSLIPYRTFQEVEQPASDFIFRMRSDHGVQCAIFEADGGAWKNDAMHNIKKYLSTSLKEFSRDYIVIS